MNRRKKIGDVYEIKTNKGLAYFQYTHEYTKPLNKKWPSEIKGFGEQKDVLQSILDDRIP